MLSETEKKEMVADGLDPGRRRLFQLAREFSQQGNLDDYIDFLSENMTNIETYPTQKICEDYRL